VSTATRGTREIVQIDSVAVALTRPDKVLFPSDGITKGDLVEHYRRVAARMLPLVHDRPLSYVRYPDGIRGESFFQQAAASYFPMWIERSRMPKEHGHVDHVLCQSEATLAYLANQAAVTLHTWLSRADSPDRPDRLLFDLDPPEGRFAEAVFAARAVHALLGDLGLPALLSTTGGRGLHVYVPIARRQDSGTVREFARNMTGLLAAREPSRFTTDVRKNHRGGRVYLDISRNAYAQNAVAPYSVRARPGAPVATPLDWAELDDKRLDPGRFTVRSIAGRLDQEDPWRNPPSAGSLRAAREQLEAMTTEAVEQPQSG
jgi:bifunctional non-homologous end joining protein LigD